eukprot:TRINITY_DN5842_c0_g1_i1.p1 TRINITY_DN5842_c0_g1~~TRINITY_DN5842_c0_g1_i1.p1  ORF type:complete len:162 (-),score=16.20 TRINITY_DN5842_c0_g1_i1:40-525(-)
MSSLPVSFFHHKTKKIEFINSIQSTLPSNRVPPHELLTDNVVDIVKPPSKELNSIVKKEKPNEKEEPWTILFKYAAHSVDRAVTERATHRFLDSVYCRYAGRAPKFVIVTMPPQGKYHGRRWQCKKQPKSKKIEKGRTKEPYNMRTFNQKPIEDWLYFNAK